jgi:hypothetical protein
MELTFAQKDIVKNMLMMTTGEAIESWISINSSSYYDTIQYVSDVLDQTSASLSINELYTFQTRFIESGSFIIYGIIDANKSDDALQIMGAVSASIFG